MTVISRSKTSDKRPANAPYVDLRLCYSPEVSSERRCRSKGRGGVYDPVFGICCHFCRFISILSFCFDLIWGFLYFCCFLLFCYEMEEVRENKQWKCPHCIEEEGTRPYWICNSSLWLKKRKMVPTGIAIFRGHLGFRESEKNYVLDEDDYELLQDNVGFYCPKVSKKFKRLKKVRADADEGQSGFSDEEEYDIIGKGW
ncbi:putative Zinc-finger domain of monoamine-oxidase A repressor R1, Spt6 acidic [Helianthus annuus]|nr:putative Zinc-finger domain of monoamine-oxidase A repressor R1, Spt6 acidic [Helianthus annuus]